MNLQDFAERYTAAWCSEDPARVATFFAEDGSLQVNDGPPAVGREAIAAVARSFMTDFPDLQIILDRLVLDPPQYHWTLVGTHGRTRRPVRVSGVEIWTMSADGLIARSLGAFDASDYVRQVGT